MKEVRFSNVLSKSGLLLLAFISSLVGCPAEAMRDERTPCIMDVVSYCELASTVWDTSSYWKNFLLNNLSKGGNPEWDGAQLALAWNLYTFYGDRRLLEQVYPTMKAYIENTMQRWPEGIADQYFLTLIGAGDAPPCDLGIRS